MNRTRNTLRNSVASIASQVLIVIFKFVIRKIFITYLGYELLGYNGLFTGILNFLNLAEMGVGTAIIYQMYRPVAENDHVTINAFMRVFRGLYNKIGVCIFAAGLAVIPLLPYLIKDQIKDYGFAVLIYVIQLSSVAATYFFSYKRELIKVNQKGYIVSLTESLVSCSMLVVQLVLLVAFKNYILYLICNGTQVLITNIIVSIYVAKNYAYTKNPVDPELLSEKKKLVRVDIKNVVISRISNYVFYSTDNIILSIMMGLEIVGIYSNYFMFFSVFWTIIFQLTLAIQPSLGNQIVDSGSDKGRIEQTTKRTVFMMHIFGNVFCGAALGSIQGVVAWLGNGEGMLSFSVVILLCFIYYAQVLARPLDSLFASLGYFRYEKIIVITAAVVNIVLSVIMVNIWGVSGVFAGTLVAQAIYLVSRVRIVYKHYFEKSPRGFALLLTRYFLVAVLTAIPGFLLSRLLPVGLWQALIVAVSSIVFITFINILIYRKTEPYKFFKSVALGAVKSIIKR